jgi:hypothetical protein
MSYAERAIDPVTGKIRPYREVAQAEIDSREAARRATMLAKAETEARKSETQRRLELAERLLAEKRHNDLPGQKIFKDHVANLKQQLADEKAQAAKEQAFASNDLVRHIRQEGDYLEKQGHVYFRESSRADIDMLVAISRSTSYPDPESMLDDYRALYDRLHTENLAAEQAKEREHEEQMLRSGLAHAESQVRIAELQQAKSRTLAGDRLQSDDQGRPQ